ncbi:MAG: hypothetical protein OXU20_29655 [Myxococcales bacterium]|nr:hypothetical protein [Myxococcales bacterium]MDD9967540.1 hypothetical protein [Myxococcales bacterium]
MRVLIHIGSTKTGSSAFQAYCDSQRDALGRLGVLYPSVGVVDGAHHLLAAASHPTAHRMHADFFEQQNKPREKLFFEMASEIEAQAQQSGCHTLLLSSEYLWGVFPEEVYAAWRKAFAFAPIQVGALLRRPDNWVQSVYLQAVKNGQQQDFDTWYAQAKTVPRGGHDFYRVLRNWADITAEHEAHVLVYEDLVKTGRFCTSVLGSLCEQASSSSALHEDNPTSNPSPDLETLDLLLAVNRSDIPAETQKKLRNILMNRGSGRRAIGTDIDLLPLKQRLLILRDYIPSLENIVRDFRTQKQGKLFTFNIQRG